MNEQTRESKFLDAINQYAAKQKEKIGIEVETYKSQRIEQATQEGLQDAYNLIKKDIASRKAQIVTSVAREENELRKELYIERQRIYHDIFRRAKDRLIDFTSTKEYVVKLCAYAESISRIIEGASCTVKIAEKDMDKAAMIRSILPEAEIIPDSAIRIGGIKAFCPTLGIMADETLDTKLKEQQKWFIENAKLKVV